MHSKILTLFAMALAGVFVNTVKADDTIEWYAIFYKDEYGCQYLDSQKANVIVNRQPSIDYINSGGDKGLRWKFLSGRGQDGFFATQAHSSKIVGYDASDNEFHADFKRSNDDTAVMAHFINDTHLTLCYNENCIGADAKKTTKKFVWTIEQLSQA